MTPGLTGPLDSRLDARHTLGMPGVEAIARALLGWAPWILLPVFALHATGDPADAALAAAGGVAMLFLFYRLSPDPTLPADGPLRIAKAEPGTITVRLDEEKPLRPDHDVAQHAPPEEHVEAPASDAGSVRLVLELASAPTFVALGYLQHGASGRDWPGALLYAGLACAVLFSIAAPVAAVVNRVKSDRTPDSAGWGPVIPLAAAAFAIFFVVFGDAGFRILGTAAAGIIVVALIVKDYKDAWNGTGRHRRR